MSVDISALGAIQDIPVELKVVVGTKTMRVRDLMKLGRGAEIMLDTMADEPVTIFMNNRPIARGELVVTEGRLGVTLTEIYRATKK